MVTTEFPSTRSKRIKDFLKLYNKSLSDLEKEKSRKIEGKNNNEETKKIIKYYDEAGIEINKYFREFKKGFDILKWVERVELLKLFLPTLLMIEVLHIALQEFGWSLWYEGMYPGLNGRYVVFIILIMLLYFILTIFISVTLSEKKVHDLEFKIISVTAKYVYDFS